MPVAPGILIGAAAVFAVALFQHARTGHKGDTLAAILLATGIGVFIGMQVQKGLSGSGGIDELAKVTTFEQFGELLAEDTPLLVMTYSEDCHYCHTLAPTIVELSREYVGRVNVVAVEHDAVEPELAQAFSLRGYPTVFIYSGGLERAQFAGVRPRADYTNIIDGLLAVESAPDAVEPIGTQGTE